MIVINTKIKAYNSKKLTTLIQGYLYSLLPEREHEGYEFRPGRNFKKTNFDYKLTKNNLTIRFSSIDPELEKAVLKITPLEFRILINLCSHRALLQIEDYSIGV